MNIILMILGFFSGIVISFFPIRKELKKRNSKKKEYEDKSKKLSLLMNVSKEIQK